MQSREKREEYDRSAREKRKANELRKKQAKLKQPAPPAKKARLSVKAEASPSTDTSPEPKPSSSRKLAKPSSPIAFARFITNRLVKLYPTPDTNEEAIGEVPMNHTLKASASQVNAQGKWVRVSTTATFQHLYPSIRGVGRQESWAIKQPAKSNKIYLQQDNNPEERVAQRNSKARNAVKVEKEDKPRLRRSKRIPPPDSPISSKSSDDEDEASDASVAVLEQPSAAPQNPPVVVDLLTTTTEETGSDDEQEQGHSADGPALFHHVDDEIGRDGTDSDEDPLATRNHVPPRKQLAPARRALTFVSPDLAGNPGSPEASAGPSHEFVAPAQTVNHTGQTAQSNTDQEPAVVPDASSQLADSDREVDSSASSNRLIIDTDVNASSDRDASSESEDQAATSGALLSEFSKQPEDVTSLDKALLSNGPAVTPTVVSVCRLSGVLTDIKDIPQQSPLLSQPRGTARPGVGDSRRATIRKLLVAEAARNGRNNPSNSDVTVEILKKVISVAKPSDYGPPAFKDSTVDHLIEFYSRMLGQVEAWMERHLLENRQMAAPTLYVASWLLPSWWWCTPTSNLKSLIRTRYHGLPTGSGIIKWKSIEVDPEAMNRSRLDPFFACW